MTNLKASLMLMLAVTSMAPSFDYNTEHLLVCQQISMLNYRVDSEFSVSDYDNVDSCIEAAFPEVVCSFLDTPPTGSRI